MKFSKKLSLLITVLLLGSLAVLPTGAGNSLQAEDFANPAFSKIWSQTDQAVKQGQASRTWMWGPEPGISRQEAYAEAPNGLRLVQYFDKSRMEITKPSADPNSAYYVTNGLLARELVSGWMQSGDTRAEMRNPAQEPIGGDPGNSGPTYATFTNLASLNNDHRAERRTGFITQSIDRTGKVGTTTTSANLSNYAYYSEELGHNIPDVFYGTFLQWKTSLGLDWVYALGLPITEPYWATFKVGGVEKELLVQIYERRALTFTPNNPPGYLVEMGNIGQHYYRWRYGNSTSITPTTAPVTTTVTSATTAPATTAVPGATTAPVTTAVPGATTAPATNTPTAVLGATTAPTTNTPTAVPGATTAPATTAVPGANTPTAIPTATTAPIATNTPTPTTAPIDTPTTTPTTRAASASTPTTLRLSREESQVLTKINDYRVQNGKSTLNPDERLMNAARWYSTDMASKNYYNENHIDSLMRSFNQRLAAFGFTGLFMGENTAINSITAAEAVQAWINSPQDSANLLGSDFSLIGIGWGYNANSDYKNYWVIDLGSNN